MLKDKRSWPIGMFDSGIGGLTVMQRIIDHLPNEQILYFGDTARLPYGEKSAETVVRYATENAIFLMNKQIKLLVVACHTASAHSMEKLRQLFNVPMVGVVDVAVQQAVLETKNQKIAVLGTKSTIASAVYEKAILEKLPEARVWSIPCPLFVPLVEENFWSHTAAKHIVREYLIPLKNQQIDVLILGCTHYPLLTPLIQEELPGVKIIDPAVSCASTVASLLALHDLHAAQTTDTKDHQLFVSDDPQKFSSLATTVLGRELSPAQKVTVGS